MVDAYLSTHFKGQIHLNLTTKKKMLSKRFIIGVVVPIILIMTEVQTKSNKDDFPQSMKLVWT